MVFKYRKIAYVVMLIVTTVIIVFLSLTPLSNDLCEERKHSRGSFEGNLGNTGRMAQNGCSVYFATLGIDNYARLITSDLNGGNRVVLVEYLTGSQFSEIVNDFPFDFPLDVKLHVPSDEIRGINVTDEWIFYIGANRRVYRVDVNGMGKQRLNNTETWRLFVHNDRIYFTCNYHMLHEMDLDGENERLLLNKEVGGLAFHNDNIFIRRYGQVYKMCSRTSQVQEIFNSHDTSVLDFHIFNDMLYLEVNRSIIRVDTHGDNIVKIVSVNRGPGEGSIFFENHFIYINRVKNFLGLERGIFHRVDLKTGEVYTRNIRHAPTLVYIVNNRLFFSNTLGISSLSLDGRNLRRFSRVTDFFQ